MAGDSGKSNVAYGTNTALSVWENPRIAKEMTMSELLFADNKGKFPELAEAYKRQFSARGQAITAMVVLTKKDGEMEIDITWINKKNIIQLGGKQKITEAIKKRIVEKNYDLFVEEGQKLAIAI